MSVSEFSQLIISVSLAFAIIGISFQLIRLLGTTNETLKDFRHIAYQTSNILDSVQAEVDKIRSVLSGALNLIEKMEDNIMQPLSKTSAILGGIIEAINSKVTSRFN